jgi:hypothetical protein
MTTKSVQAAQLRRGDELTAFLSRLRARDSVTIGADVFVRLFFEEDEAETPALEVDLLDDGVVAGRTLLREVSEVGEVNRILVRHDGERMLLLLDGEQILGAKQNRVVNASFLVPQGREVAVPVSCVERGRWQYESRTFAPSETTITGMARSRMVSRVTDSVMAGHGYDARQAEVWRDVDEYLDRSQVVSRTSALEDALTAKRGGSDLSLGMLRPKPGQVGVAMVREGALVLLDAFGSADLFARAHRKVLRGMLADTRSEGEAVGGATEAVRSALDALGDVESHREPSPGCGETLRSRAPSLSASAVSYEGAVYHVVVAAAG